MRIQLDDVVEILDHRVDYHLDVELAQYRVRRKGDRTATGEWYPQSCLQRYKQLLGDYHIALTEGRYNEQKKSNMRTNENWGRNRSEAYPRTDRKAEKSNKRRSDLYFQDDEEENGGADNEEMIVLDSYKPKDRVAQRMPMEFEEEEMKEMIDLNQTTIIPRNIAIDPMVTHTETAQPLIKLVEEPPLEHPPQRKPPKKPLNFRLNKRLERKKLVPPKRAIPHEYFMTLEAQLESGVVLDDDNDDSDMTHRSDAVSESAANLVEPSPISSGDAPPLAKRCLGENHRTIVRYVNTSYDDSSSQQVLSEFNLEDRESSWSQPAKPPFKKPNSTKPCVVSIHGDQGSNGELKNPWFTIYEEGQYRTMSREELVNYNPEILSDYYQNRFLYGRDYKPNIESSFESSSRLSETSSIHINGRKKKQLNSSLESDSGEEYSEEYDR